MDIKPGDIIQVRGWQDLATQYPVTQEDTHPSSSDSVAIPFTQPDGQQTSVEFYRWMNALEDVQGMVREISPSGELRIEWDPSYADEDGNFEEDPDDVDWYPPFFTRVSSFEERTGLAIGGKFVFKTEDELLSTPGVIREVSGSLAGSFWHPRSPGNISLAGLAGQTGTIVRIIMVDDVSEDLSIALRVEMDSPSLNTLVSNSTVCVWAILPLPTDSVSQLIQLLKKGPLTVAGV